MATVDPRAFPKLEDYPADPSVVQTANLMSVEFDISLDLAYVIAYDAVAMWYALQRKTPNDTISTQVMGSIALSLKTLAKVLSISETKMDSMLGWAMVNYHHIYVRTVKTVLEERLPKTSEKDR